MNDSHELAVFEVNRSMPEQPAYLDRQPSRAQGRPPQRQYTNREHQGPPQRRQPAPDVAALPPVEFDERGNWLMRTPEHEIAFITRLKAAGALPDSFENDIQIAFAIQALKAGGMDVYASIGHVGFIYGRYTEFDDVPLAKVIRTGLLEHHEEYGFTLGQDGKYLPMLFENGNLHLPPVGAICELRRRGGKIKKFAYTDAQAQRAALKNKKGSWSSDPLVMLVRKARSRALKSVFPDVIYSDLAAPVEAAETNARQPSLFPAA